MKCILQNHLRGFQFESWPPLADVHYVFAGRSENGQGNLSLSGGRDAQAALAARKTWCDFLQIPAADLVVGSQVHGTQVRVVTNKDRGRGAMDPQSVLPNCDALVTTDYQVPLFLAVADCCALLFAAPGVVAVAHAGWRGMEAGVIPQVLRQLQNLGFAPAQLHVGIFPCIAAESYEVGPEVAEQVPSFAKYRGQGDRWQVDMGLWAQHVLLQVGISLKHLRRAKIDTGCDTRFFSHRRQGLGAGRNALIAVRKPPLINA